MRNLVIFLKRFQIFLVFALLQVVALSIHFSHQSYPRARFSHTAGAISGQVMEMRHAVTKHFNLSRANLLLQEENIELRRQMPMSFIPLQSAMTKINDTLYRQQYSYIAATVLNSTFDKLNNYLTINAGTFQGVERGMGVFNHSGAVGYVFAVSEHFALVKTILSENINMDVYTTNGAFGLLKWDGKNPTEAYITGIANDIELKIGDVVSTRGTRGLFPRGIPIGKVRALNLVEGDPMWDVRVELAVDFRRISHVYVIENLLKEEQDKLEMYME
jgi:rod shape-determining protein MreC